MDIMKALELVGNRDDWELKVMIKALSSLNGFFNSDEDNRRLEACKIVLKRRGVRA